jgi:tyrosinase
MPISSRWLLVAFALALPISPGCRGARAPVLPRPIAPLAELPVVGSSGHPVILVGREERVRVPVAPGTLAEAARPTSAARVVLELGQIQAERNPDVVYGVYLNLPAHPSEAELLGHHVGSIALYGIEKMDPALGGMRLVFEITEAVRRVGAGDEALELTFRPTEPAIREDAPDAEEVREAYRRMRDHRDQPISVGTIRIRAG